MEEKHYYHVFANGDDVKSLVISETDFAFQFNLVAVCAFVSGVKILAFSIEESHPHFLLYGTTEQCCRFIERYRHATLVHIASTRNSTEGVVLEFDKLIVNNEDYLRNVAAYVVIQPTKDGKKVMYYDYKWGTGSMYFRPEGHISLWKNCNGIGNNLEVKHFRELNYREQEAISSKTKLPGDWEIINGLILPENYVDVKGYEKIFRTHNCFRAFSGAGKNQIQCVVSTMAEIRGISMEDTEARTICKEMCNKLYGCADCRKLNMSQRLTLAGEIRKDYRLSYRQLATLCLLPKNEIEKYFLTEQ